MKIIIFEKQLLNGVINPYQWVKVFVNKNNSEIQTFNMFAGAVVAIAGFIGGVTYVDAITNCDNGITTGKGVRVTGWDKPSTGCIMGVQARY